jgi:hypothetical protein
MTLPFVKSKRILIPDVPPPSVRESDPGFVIAGIGVFCGLVVIAAMLFVFLGA